MKYLSFLSLSIFLMVSSQSCNYGRVANLAPNAHQVKALEILQTSAYTYVRVKDDNKEYWLAVNKMDVKEGKTYFWSVGEQSNDFASKELKRTFPELYLVMDFTDKPITADQKSKDRDLINASMAGKPQTAEKSGISVKKDEGGITIAELYSKSSTFGGKEVKIRGEVVRFSKEIMHKNWVHLQDGTKDGKNFDLTVTTLDTVKVGDVVLFKGVISLNKDFGYGTCMM